jgi:hypothetical protein
LGIKSQAFKSCLLAAYYHQTKSAPASEALTMAIRTLEAKACHEGKEQNVSIRVGADGESHYLDLCDRAWGVVAINDGSWEVLDRSPIPFRRSNGMLQLPTPVPGGNLELLRHFVNVANDDDFKLLVVFDPPWGTRVGQEHCVSGPTNAC